MDCQLFVFLRPFEEHFNRFPNRAGYLIFSYRRVPARQDKRHLLDVLRTRRQKSLFLDLLSSPVTAVTISVQFLRVGETSLHRLAARLV